MFLLLHNEEVTFSLEETLQSCVWNDLGARWISVGTVATTLHVESNTSSEPTKNEIKYMDVKLIKQQYNYKQKKA